MVESLFANPKLDVSDGCGFDAVATENGQEFSSPGYPDKYFNDLHCEWNFEADPGLRIQIKFFDLYVEPDYDFVKVSI